MNSTHPRELLLKHNFLQDLKTEDISSGHHNLSGLMKFRLGYYISEPVESLNTGFFELQTFKFLLQAHIHTLPMTCKLLFYYLQPKSPLLNSSVIIREQGFSPDFLVFLPPQKLIPLNSNSIWNSG